MPITIRGYVPSQEKIVIAAEIVFTPQDEQETSYGLQKLHCIFRHN